MKLHSTLTLDKGSLTNYVYKTRYVGGPKMCTLCQRSYHRKCQCRGVGGQKSQNLVNVVCEWPLMYLQACFCMWCYNGFMKRTF